MSDNSNTEELKRLAEKATPGPWTSGCVEMNDETLSFVVERANALRFDIDYALVVSRYKDDPNCEFIAAANPQMILKLIEQREKLLSKLRLILHAQAGSPDPREACRLVIQTATEAIKVLEGE